MVYYARIAGIVWSEAILKNLRVFVSPRAPRLGAPSGWLRQGDTLRLSFNIKQDTFAPSITRNKRDPETRARGLMTRDGGSMSSASSDSELGIGNAKRRVGYTPHKDQTHAGARLSISLVESD